MQQDKPKLFFIFEMVKLADMGYTNIYEFGGINTWTGEIEK